METMAYSPKIDLSDQRSELPKSFKKYLLPLEGED